jgi:hypothetical protein
LNVGNNVGGDGDAPVGANSAALTYAPVSPLQGYGGHIASDNAI